MVYIVSVFIYMCVYTRMYIYIMEYCIHAQSCLTLWDSMDYSPLGSSVHGIFQPRTLEWVAISSPRGSSWPRDQTCISCIGRQILYQWATREASVKFSSSHNFLIIQEKTSKTKQNNSSSENKVAVSIPTPCAFCIPFNPSILSTHAATTISWAAYY